MNLANINLETIFNNIELIGKEIFIDTMTLNSIKFNGLIQTARLVFGSNFKVKLGDKVQSTLFPEQIIDASRNYDNIRLFINSSEITFSFDDESNHWIVVTTTDPEYKTILSNLIGLKKIAAKEKFEINLGSYKVLQIANELRKP